MSERLSFTLDGRDNLSRVLDRAGDAATRMSRRIMAASNNSDMAVRRFANNSIRSLANIDRSSHDGARAMETLRASAISLAPAVLPAAASFAPLAAGLGAAAAGIGAFGLALGPQISAMGEATEAEEKYNQAVETSGARSAEAVKAHADYVRAVSKLPPATREAAAALGILKDQYSDWSNSLAKDTMAPVTKSFAILGSVLPKLTPTVQGASRELDRLVTIAGGAVASPGFDAFTGRLDGVTTGAIKRANDALIRLMRTADTGQVSPALARFMNYAREQGPAVADTLKNLATALLNILEGASGVGVGMLTVVNALSKLATAVPPGAISLLLQLAIAIKGVQLAAVGIAAARETLARFGTQLVAMRTAAAAAPGPLAATSAAITTLSRTAKLAIAGTGIGLLVIALSELAQMSRTTPPDVDALTSSLKKLGATNAATGEAARLFGADLDGLYDKVRALTDPSENEKFEQMMTGLVSLDPKGLKDAKEAVGGLDKSLADLVSSGRADLAATALARLTAEYAAGGHDADALTGHLTAYKDALADAKFEQDLVAASMGVYGQQAMEVKAKLDAQKQSADGLRQSLHALNEATLMARGGIRGMEAAIDAASDALKTNGATLDDNTAKGRANNQALDELASTTMKAVEAKYQETGSWSQAMAIYDRGRGQLVSLATQMYGNEKAAKNLADQILRTPNKTAMLKGDIGDLQAKINAAKQQLARVPDGRKAQIRADIGQLEAQLAAARRQLASLDGRTSTTYVQTVFITKYGTVGHPKGSGGRERAQGGPISGPGTSTSDSIPLWASDGEYVIKASSVRKYGMGFMDDLNAGRLGSTSSRPAVPGPGVSVGVASQAGAGQDVGAGLAAGMLRARAGVEQAARGMAAGVEAGVRDELQIASPSKKMLALMQDVKGGIIKGLTGSRAQIQATVKDLVADIWKAWEGKKTNLDSWLVKAVNREHGRLQKLAVQRDYLKGRIAGAQATLNARIEERDKYRAEVRSTVQGSATLSSLGLEPDQVRPGTIRGGLQAKLARIRQFGRYIQALGKRGLHKSLLKQVLAMGPEEGLPYAAALVGMTNADFKQVNSLQAQIDTEADNIGKAGSGALYDAGVNSAKGLLKGLQSQQAAIEKQMLKIAQGMEKAIKKALGIKSPSRVGQAIGLNFGQSIGGGALAALPDVGRAVDAVAGRMAGIRPAAGIPAPGRAAPVAAGGGGPTYYFTVQGAIDPVGTAKTIQRVLLADKRLAGGVARGFE